MGNFSYIAQNTNEAILNPFSGRTDTLCELQLVIGGQVVERMRGTYSGYGAVLLERDFKHYVVKEGVEVDITEETKARAAQRSFDGDTWVSTEWDTIVDIHFDETSDGIAAWHLGNMEEVVPLATRKSKDDPGQGDREFPEDDFDDEFDFEDEDQ